MVDHKLKNDINKSAQYKAKKKEQVQAKRSIQLINISIIFNARTLIGLFIHRPLQGGCVVRVKVFDCL
ncbi:MAG: hypothetical protein K0S39_5064 [Paenibacillus sp.]|nr:hypothetical protein [Paenibacillus sp.]